MTGQLKKTPEKMQTLAFAPRLISIMQVYFLDLIVQQRQYYIAARLLMNKMRTDGMSNNSGRERRNPCHGEKLGG